MTLTTNHNREVYAEAPLALVALEIKFPSEASVKEFGTTSQKAFRDRLNAVGEWVIESSQLQQVEVSFGATAAQTIRSVNVPRLLTRNRATAVSFPPGAVTIETTTYDGYQQFRELVKTVLDAIEELLLPESVARVGLRYIDEIRVPDDVALNPQRWADWLHGSLLPPSLPSELPGAPSIAVWTSAAQYQMGLGRSLVVRYGPQIGPVVTPAMPLRRPTNPPSGPVFVLDFDSSWQPDMFPTFSPAELITTCDLLHVPASATFESFITDKLRNVFRGKQ